MVCTRSRLVWYVPLHNDDGFLVTSFLGNHDHMASEKDLSQCIESTPDSSRENRRSMGRKEAVFGCVNTVVRERRPRACSKNQEKICIGPPRQDECPPQCHPPRPIPQPRRLEVGSHFGRVSLTSFHQNFLVMR